MPDDPTMPADASAPQVDLDPAAVFDLELVLMRVLQGAQPLGMPLTVADPAAPGVDPPEVRLQLPEELAVLVAAAGSVVLRDHESTPLALLEDVHVDAPASAGSGLELAGRARALRPRESGENRAEALRPGDLESADALVVVGRPPMTGDAEALAAAVAAASGRVLVLVSEGPSQDGLVPGSVMLRLARLLAAELGPPERVQVRSAPLAWRDPDSDLVLGQLLSSAAGAVPLVHLAARDEAKGARQWQEAREALQLGTDAQLSLLSPGAEPVLRRWRPPRHERGLVVMFTGLSGSGKSTLARALRERIASLSDRSVTLLDGDVVRQMLSAGLGFDKASREMNVRRIGYVASEIARHGGIAVCAPIAPYASTRAAVRAMVEPVGDMVLVHVSTPLEECEARDLKGLYAKARAGLVPGFTGVSDPYEEPLDAEVTVDTSQMEPEEAVAHVLGYLRVGGWLAEVDA
ncbi:MAG: adenylyl-sulfate kinase [Oryzihumus sp.]